MQTQGQLNPYPETHVQSSNMRNMFFIEFVSTHDLCGFQCRQSVDFFDVHLCELYLMVCASTRCSRCIIIYSDKTVFIVKSYHPYFLEMVGLFISLTDKYLILANTHILLSISLGLVNPFYFLYILDIIIRNIIFDLWLALRRPCQFN